jgi:uncharacterized coiled-coil protein SlyX
VANGSTSMESRIADLEAKLASLHREIQVLADAVTRAIDASMHVKLELEELRLGRRRAKRTAADEAA